MWELDYEEGWAPKNWCFWTVVLEKILESPLNCKEIEPVHSEGDQPWDFFGGNDVVWKKSQSPKVMNGVISSVSVQFSCSVMSDSLWPHGLQHARLPCPSPTPGNCSNSCPSSRWCHPTISSSVVPFSSHLQSLPVSGSSQMSQFFTLAGQSIGVSASASVLPMNIQDWFFLGLTGWISLQSKGFSSVFFNATVQKHQFFGDQLSSWSSSHIHTWLLGKP